MSCVLDDIGFDTNSTVRSPGTFPTSDFKFSSIAFLSFSFVADMLIEIAKGEIVIPDYVTIDYLIYLAIRTFPETHRDLEKAKDIPCANRHRLALMMNETYNHDRYKELIENDFIFKLSFRANWQKTTKDGTETFYGRILKDVI